MLSYDKFHLKLDGFYFKMEKKRIARFIQLKNLKKKQNNDIIMPISEGITCIKELNYL